MPLYHDNPIVAGLLLVSFMTITFYFCMNLLLGVVYIEYQKLMGEKVHTVLEATTDRTGLLVDNSASIAASYVARSFSRVASCIIVSVRSR